jgi:hypothetical protein
MRTGTGPARFRLFFQPSLAILSVVVAGCKLEIENPVVTLQK